MAGRLYTFQCTVPASTAITSPATFSLAIPSGSSVSVTVRIPPGPRGEVGWQLYYGGSLAFPYQTGTWLVADDAVVTIEPPADMTSGAWRLSAYNTGTYPHTLYIEVRADTTTQAAAQVTVSVPVYVSPSSTEQTYLPTASELPAEEQLPSETVPSEEVPAAQVPAETVPAEQVLTPTPTQPKSVSRGLIGRKLLDVPIAVYNHRTQWDAGWEQRKQWMTTSDAPRKRGFVRLAVPVEAYNHRDQWQKGWSLRQDWRV
jgi:hypothetical protein